MKKKNQGHPPVSGSGENSLMVVAFASPFSLTTGFIKERFFIINRFISKGVLIKKYDVKINPKSQKSLEFTPVLKGVLAISAFSPFRNKLIYKKVFL